MKQLLKSHRYELIAFMTGAAVMVLEIIGARLIAPYFGSSTYVWTAMIGVILGALAAGYALGGRMADRDDTKNSLVYLLLVAAVLVAGLGIVQGSVLSWLAGFELDLRLSTLLAAVLLFAAPSLLIGMVSPHLAKIRITSLLTSGKSVGRLEAAGALGSICGTFLCGYVLLGAFGSRTLVLGVAIALVLTSFLAMPRRWYALRFGIIIAAALIGSGLQLPQNIRADIDTSYARYQVRDYMYGGESITALTTDQLGLQSGVSKTDPDRLVFPYTQAFDAALRAKPDAQSILVIGGGTFTFPQIAARQNPNLTVDAVEIDPRLTTIAEDYFNYEALANLQIINEDGRTYLNRSSEQYDMIFMDAYNAVSPPFQVTTREALAAAEQRLRPGGVLVSNAIGRSDASNDPYLQAMRATIASVFRYSESYPTIARVAYGQQLNFVTIGSQDSVMIAAVERSLAIKPVSAKPEGIVLTDDFAPIEQLIRRSGN